VALDFLQYAHFSGPALPEPFVRSDLEKELHNRNLLPRMTGESGRELQASWDIYRRKLRELVASGGVVRVRSHVIDLLIDRLGYNRLDEASDVATREGLEQGGHLLVAEGTHLRVWSAPVAEDLDAPSRRGRAYRFSHTQIARRVLLAAGERLGLLTNGLELRLLISDPARTDSQIEIPIDPYWKRSRDVPDSYVLLLALASPSGVRALPEIVEKARLQQTKVTKELRRQAREAVESFVQEILDHPENRERLAAYPDRERLACTLWHEGLITIYRLLFIFKLESSDDPARAFSFASTSLWRNSFSPTTALAQQVKAVLEEGQESGRLLEDGLRTLFRLFTQGMSCTELRIEPLGGALFGEEAIPILGRLRWGERAAAHLLDRLLWTSRGRGTNARERVHYGTLDVEDLGRVYEALLELEPGITREIMCRLRRRKLEVVVPFAQGERYRPAAPAASEANEPDYYKVAEEPDEEDDEVEEDQAPYSGRQTKVEWIEEISPGRFYLRVGLGRKASGSYYTPHSFVRFLIRETLGPQVAERCPSDDPHPAELLKIKVLDPAMGSGHFLVEACRFLGEKLYEACRSCDEFALAAEKATEQAKTKELREKSQAEAAEYRQRLVAIPDPDQTLISYLPSHAPEGEESGLSQKRAEAVCRRLAAVHCLYGVDKNPLAVELAKLSIWLESHAEGLPLTFLDHRFVVGDSLTGPFFEQILKYPGTQKAMEDLFTEGLQERLSKTLNNALRNVGDLEAGIGISLSELEAKRASKERLDRGLAPFRIIAAAWAGGIMLGREKCDDQAYADLVHYVAETGDLPETLADMPNLSPMIAKGLGVEEVPIERQDLLNKLLSPNLVSAFPYELAFPEVFHPEGRVGERRGFHAVLGNPPWKQEEVSEAEFWAAKDLAFLDLNQSDRHRLISLLNANNPELRDEWNSYVSVVQGHLSLYNILYSKLSEPIADIRTSGRPDYFQLFTIKAFDLLAKFGIFGMVLPSGFHNNEGAGQLRNLIFENLSLKICYSFENKRKLFEIDSRFKFACVVVEKSTRTLNSFSAAFYLHDDKWLFSDTPNPPRLEYSDEFIKRTGGPLRVFVECRDQKDVEVLEQCYSQSIQWKLLASQMHLDLRQGMSSTREAWRRIPLNILQQDYYCYRTHSNEVAFKVLEGKMIWFYNDSFDTEPLEAVPWSKMPQRTHWNQSLKYYRLAQRRIASSTNKRTSIYCILPPGVMVLESLRVEASPQLHATSVMLYMMAVLNAYSFDFCTRLIVGAAVSEFLIDLIPFTQIEGEISRFLSHNSLRLVCNSKKFEQLWVDNLSYVWREAKPAFTWPALAKEDERWAVRSAIDAIVAASYGLSRDQYAHVLSSFSHRSYPNAPDLCLTRFDELKTIGLDAFTKKYDPYWDIPLNEALPTPVIELPIRETEPVSEGTAVMEQALPLGIDPPKLRKRRKAGR
jgi:hypothetical protein